MSQYFSQHTCRGISLPRRRGLVGGFLGDRTERYTSTSTLTVRQRSLHSSSGRTHAHQTCPRLQARGGWCRHRTGAGDGLAGPLDLLGRSAGVEHRHRDGRLRRTATPTQAQGAPERSGRGLKDRHALHCAELLGSELQQHRQHRHQRHLLRGLRWKCHILHRHRAI